MNILQGLKLRQVIDGTLPSVEGATHGWAIRGPERTLIDLQKCRIAPEVSRPLRMSFFDCNRPGTDGYAAAIEGFHLLKLVAHHPGGDISFYGDLDNAAMPVMWMYMPLNPGETVREISAIRLFSNFVALLVRMTCASTRGKPHPDIVPSFTRAKSEPSSSGATT